MLNVRGRRAVIVGGGRVAARRAGGLLDAGARVTVVSPRFDERLDAPALERVERPYRSGDLAGAFLVVVATDDPNVNEAAAAEARSVGALLNRADEPERGDLVVPAHARRGPVTLSVHTDGVSPAAAAAIRDSLADALDPDWARLLDAARPFRNRVQQRAEPQNERAQRLRRLTDAHAMDLLKREGMEALRRHLHAVASEEAPTP